MTLRKRLDDMDRRMCGAQSDTRLMRTAELKAFISAELGFMPTIDEWDRLIDAFGDDSQNLGLVDLCVIANIPTQRPAA